MKLYIFEPYKFDWCGGAIVVVAEDFEQAVDFIMEIKNRHGRGLKYDRSRLLKNKDNYSWDKSVYNQWVLTHELELAEPHDPGVIVENWNDLD